MKSEFVEECFVRSRRNSETGNFRIAKVFDRSGQRIKPRTSRTSSERRM